VATEWVGPNHRLHLRCQAIKAVAQINPMAGQEYLGARRHGSRFPADRPLYSRLSDIRCRRATTETLPPSASTSAYSAPFSRGVHFRGRSTRATISTSPNRPSFWSYRRSSRGQHHLDRSPIAPHGRYRTLTLGPNGKGQDLRRAYEHLSILKIALNFLLTLE
jgi:hypothetical protein